MARRKQEITVEVVWPKEPEAILEIERRKAQWVFERQRERYGDETFLPIKKLYKE